MKYFRKIEGENIYLSPINVEDVETYMKWMNDKSVTDNIGRTQYVTTFESEKEWIESINKGNKYQFAIVNNDNKLIGNCSLFDIDFINGNATVGIFIGEEEYRNKGLGTEALKILIGYGFNNLNLNNIMLTVFSFNERAIKCYRKVGFKEFGRRRKCLMKNNKRYDTIYMDIIREEYYKE